MDERTRKVMHSSDRLDWRTPPDLFEALDNDFGFSFDAAACENSKLCDSYASVSGAHQLDGDGKWVFNKEADGLTGRWYNNTFCNPPYGRGIKHWLEKAYDEAVDNNVTSALLVPARTDTTYWHDFVMTEAVKEVRLIKGRVKFRLPDGSSTAPAPFPSAVVVFSPPPSGVILPGNRSPKFVPWDWR